MLDDLTQELDFGIDWELANEDAERWARQYGYSLVNRLNNTTRRRLAAEIAEWTQNSETINQLAARLAGLFDARRARTIAVTEVTRAYAQGNQAAWARSKVIDAKRWNTANDELVCPICGPLNGRIVPLSGTFDGIDNPPAHPNCRCWITPVVMEVETEDQLANAQVFANPVFSSTKEAESWARATFGGDFQYDGLSPDQANAINEALAKYANRMPNHQLNDYSVRVNENLNAVAQAHASGRRGVTINPQSFSQSELDYGRQMQVPEYQKKLERLQRKLENNRDWFTAEQIEFTEKRINELQRLIDNTHEAARFARHDNLAEIILHELGHTTHNDLMSGVYKNVSDFLPPSQQSELGRSIDDNMNRRLSSLSLMDKTRVSVYASTNVDEYMAEAFVAYMKGDHDVIYPPLLDLFKEIST